MDWYPAFGHRFALGAFLGPTLAGILFDAVGFPWATMVIIGNEIIVMILLMLWFVLGYCKLTSRRREKKQRTGEGKLLPNGPEDGSGYGSTEDHKLITTN